MKSVATHRPDTVAAHQAAVERVVQHMKANLIEWDADLSLKALANEARYSVPQLIETFREITGTTPAHFLSSLRIQKAKELLISTDMSVIEVALEVGYESPQSFSSKFSDFVGLPPAEFRSSPQNLMVSNVASVAGAFEASNRALSARARQSDVLQGTVQVPTNADGIIFIGTFTKGVPQGRPFSGSILLHDTSFRLVRPGRRTFHLLAVLVPPLHSTDDIPQTLSPQLVAHTFIQNARPEHLELRLRPLRATDPPLVVSLRELMRVPNNPNFE